MKIDKKQKKALKASIKHWKEDVVQWLERGYEIKNLLFRLEWCTGESVPLGTKNCACCQAYIAQNCPNCPLTLGGENCFATHSLYNKFVVTPTLTNARKMVEAMEKILKDGS